MLNAEHLDAFREGAPIGLIDLGGTLCDCADRLRDGLARLEAPDERTHGEMLEPLPPYLEARRRQVMGSPGFWRHLPMLSHGFDLLKLMRAEGFHVQVVTKGPHDAPHVWGEKVAWCRHHLPGVPVVVTDDKTLIHGHVLVDDWLPYVLRWQSHWPTGLAIVPAQPWNAHAPQTSRLIRYDGSNCYEIHAALRACREAVHSLSR